MDDRAGGDPDLAALLARLADAPRAGLRERKKAEAMRRIQQVGVEQFEEHGFDAVTIEHIAGHAEVSPSSVYRYFGTKEGVVLHDEFDDQIRAAIPVLLTHYEVHTAFEIAVQALADSHLLQPGGLAARRTRLWLEVPSIRAAGFIMLDELAREVATAMYAARPGGRTPVQCRVVAAALMAALFVGIEQWYLDGASDELTPALLDAIRLVRTAAPAIG